MNNLSKTEFRIEAEPACRKIFVNYDLTKQPFAPDVAVRRILFGYHYWLNEPLTDAMVAAATKVKDSGCYISLIWEPLEESTWYLPFTEFSSIYSGTEGLEQSPEFARLNPHSFANIIYSPQGKWGVMLVDEGFGVIGGCQKFMEEIYHLVPDLDEQANEFLDYIVHQKQVDTSGCLAVDWVLPLFRHVYGQEIGESMLREKGFFSQSG